MLQSKVKYNDTNNFCLISTSVAKPPETAYPGEELRGSTAAGCSECVWSAHTSTTPHKESLITQCLQTFSQSKLLSRWTEKLLRLRMNIWKNMSIHGKFPRCTLGQESKEKMTEKVAQSKQHWLQELAEVSEGPSTTLCKCLSSQIYALPCFTQKSVNKTRKLFRKVVLQMSSSLSGQL